MAIPANDFEAGAAEARAVLAATGRMVRPGLNRGASATRASFSDAPSYGGSPAEQADFAAGAEAARNIMMGDNTESTGLGPSRGPSLHYQIIYTAKATRIGEFRFVARTGPGGRVTAIMWGVPPHAFKRSFRIKGTTGLRGLRARTSDKRLPTRAFDGPNLAKEAVKGETAKAFFETVARAVVPAVEKQILKEFRRK